MARCSAQDSSMRPGRQAAMARQAQHLAQLSHHVHQPLIAGQGLHGFVDQVVGVVVLVDAAGLGMSGQIVVQGLQRGQFGIVGLARGLEGAAPFQHGHEREDVFRSCADSSLTKQPRRGSSRTSPSVASTLRASRSGVREMPISPASRSSSIHSPLRRARTRIMSRRRSATSGTGLAGRWERSWSDGLDCAVIHNYEHGHSRPRRGAGKARPPRDYPE